MKLSNRKGFTKNFLKLMSQIEKFCCGDNSLFQINVDDSDSATLSGTGTQDDPIISEVIISDEPGNSLTLLPDGLFATASAGEIMDVFLVGGQSNASGKGVAAQSPNPQLDTVYHYYPAALNVVTDEVGNANTGSAWPSFGITWNKLTGRKICFVPAAVESSAQVAAADIGAGNWDTSGTLYTTAVSNLNDAITAISAAGYTPVLRGILWSQGETDAVAINATTITANQYTTALTTMVTNFRGTFGSDLPFYIFRTGTRTDQSDVGYLAIRDAQDAFAYSDPLRNRMVFRNTIGFPSRLLMIDVVHYSQAGYNEMGRIGAETIAGGEDWGLQKTTIASGNISYYLPTQYAKLSIGSLQSLPTELLTVKSNNIFDSGLITSSGTTNGVLANLKAENINTGSSAAAAIRYYNNNGIGAQSAFYSSAGAFGANLLLHHCVTGSVRLASNSLDIEFSTGNITTTTVRSKMFNNGQFVFNHAGGVTLAVTDVNGAVDIQSTTKGLYLPRMTKTQRDAIPVTAASFGLAVYQTDNTPGLRVYNGTNWMRYTETID
jgi:hypothetical protein